MWELGFFKYFLQLWIELLNFSRKLFQKSFDTAIKLFPQVGRIFLQQLEKLFAVGVQQLAPDILQVISHDDLNIAISNYLKLTWNFLP